MAHSDTERCAKKKSNRERASVSRQASADVSDAGAAVIRERSSISGAAEGRSCPGNSRRGASKTASPKIFDDK